MIISEVRRGVMQIGYWQISLNCIRHLCGSRERGLLPLGMISILTLYRTCAPMPLGHHCCTESGLIVVLPVIVSLELYTPLNGRDRTSVSVNCILASRGTLPEVVKSMRSLKIHGCDSSGGKLFICPLR